MISGKPKIVVGCIEEVFETLQQVRLNFTARKSLAHLYAYNVKPFLM